IHARERRFDFKSGGLESSEQESFHHFPDPLRLRIGHLQIDLGELGLAVGAQVFVAKAADDLKILVESRDHQDLLEHLRRLRQGIERAWFHAAGYEITARAFGSRPRYEVRSDSEEALAGKIVTNSIGNFVARLDVEPQ